MQDQLQELRNEINELKSKLIAQEHRLFPSLMNAYDAFKNGLNRKEAIAAIIWNTLLRTPTVITITGAGILSAYLAFKANQILANQNELISKQNSLILSQNKLAEADRRASLVPELSRVLDEVSAESKSTHKSGNKIKLSPTLEGRIIALSKALRPYYFLDYDDEPSRQELSPERGQLLVALAEANVDLSNLVRKADFSWALLSGIKMTNKDFSGGDLPYINATGCDLIECNFSKTNMWGARFVGGDVTQCDFSHSIFKFGNLKGTRFRQTNFTGADFDGALMPYPYGFQSCNFRNVNFHHAYVTQPSWLPKVDYIINDSTIFDPSKFNIRLIEGRERREILKAFDYSKDDPNEKIYQLEHVDSVGHSHG